MPEIKKSLLSIEDTLIEDINGEERVITEQHTISDVLRYLIECSNKEEVSCCLDLIDVNY